MWSILLAEFWGDLRSQTTRASLTMVAIACGTFIVVVLLALGEGLKRAVMSEVIGNYDNAITVYPGSTSRPYQGLPPNRRIRFTDDDARLLLQRVPDLEIATPVYSAWGARLSVEGNRTPEEANVEGVSAAYGVLRRLEAAEGGRYLNDRDVDERRRVIFIGDSLAVRLFPAGNALGGVVTLNNQPFTVIGVARSKVETSIEPDGESMKARIPYSTYALIYRSTNVSTLMVRAREPQNSEAAKTALRAVLAERHRFDAADRNALYISDSAENARMAWRVLTGLQAFLGLVGGLTLLVAAVGVANIMYVAVKERTLEIGIKLAIGARKPHIMAQYVFEAVLLSLGGGVVGLGAAAGVVALVRGIPREHEALRYMLNPQMSWPIALATVGILAVIGLLAGVFPARQAARLDPVESLRYE
jgi:putative ABC transport system permease protein